MPVEVNIDVALLKSFQRAMERQVKSMWGSDMLNAMRTIVLAVQAEAKIGAPVDTGRLRSSIVPDVVSSEPSKITGIVGSNVEYAPYMEYGTHNPDGTQRIAPRRFLRNAFEKIRDRIGGNIAGVISRAMTGIKNEVERGH